MPVIPLAIGAYERTASYLPEVVCRNMVLEADRSGVSPDKTIRVQRPGLVLDQTLPSPLRGLDNRTSEGQRITVAGSRLYVNSVDQGEIAGTDLTPMVSNAFVQAILGGTQIYLYDTVLSSLAMPDNRVVQDIDQINGYVLALCPDGVFYWMVPGATEIEPLDFADAESIADGGVAIRRLGDEFLIFGTQTIEPWQATGDADAPFQRASGRMYERGCLERDTVRRFDNSIVWVGDDCQVYRIGAVPTVVSDNGIAERIRKRTGRMSAWVFTSDAHKFYCLRIPGQGTFALDASTSAWSEFSTFGKPEWAPHVGYELDGLTYAGSADDGSVWRITPDAADDAGLTMERVVTGTVPLVGAGPRNDSFSIGAAGDRDYTIRLRWKDGQDDFPNYYDELAVDAPACVADMYRLGQPDQPFRTFEISIVDTVKASIFGAVANQAWK